MNAEVSNRKCSICAATGHNSRTCLAGREKIERHPADTGKVEQHAEEDHDSDFSGTTRDSRKKGVAWSEEEHRQFLLGLQKIGKGDWRGISRQFVQTRSPTQVASHAQKYFIRQSVTGKRKRRSSLFDLVPEGPAGGKSRLAGPTPSPAQPAAPPKNEAPTLPFTGLPQGGPEAYAMACLYQNMMMQQGSMAWMQAMCGQQQPQQQPGPQFPPNDQGFGMNPMQPGFPFVPGGQEQGMGMTPQQQAQAMLMLAQHQQQLAAAYAMGTMQSQSVKPPSAAEGNSVDPSPSRREGQAEQGDKSEQESLTAYAPGRSLPASTDGQNGGSRHAEAWGTKQGEPPPEQFGNGMLIRPKAQKAYPPRPHEAGAPPLPSWMTASQAPSAAPHPSSSMSDFTQTQAPQFTSAFPSEASGFTASGGSSGMPSRGPTPPGGSEGGVGLRRSPPSSNEQKSGDSTQPVPEGLA